MCFFFTVTSHLVKNYLVFLNSLITVIELVISVKENVLITVTESNKKGNSKASQ